MRYKAKRGLQGGVTAEVAGVELKRLMDVHGSIQPEQVVRSAQKKSSPIHSCFTWDNTAAAYKCRIAEARYLLRTVTVEYDEGDKTHTTRAFVTVKEAEYQTIESVLSDNELRELLLEQAKDDLNAIRTKYRHLKELALVFEAIENI